MEERLGVYRYMSPDRNGDSVNVWHIHGEIGRPSSVVLSHYYYWEMIACIRNYIPTLLRRYNGLRKTGEYSPLSWIDYFMIGNVYIVRLGLDPSEMDLWWLINCKKHYSNKFGIECYTEELGKRIVETQFPKASDLYMSENLVVADLPIMEYRSRRKALQ